MWIKAEDEERLVALRRMKAGAPVLSVYVNVDKGLALHHGHLAAAMDLLKELRGRVDPTVSDAFEVEAAKALEFVRGEEYVPSGQTIAIFSSTKRRLWHVLNFDLALKPIARFTARPYLAPIEAALEDHPRTVVALVDNEKARIMSMVMGEIEGGYRLSDAVPGRQRQGGWSAFKYQRDRERHIDTHMAHVARSLADLERSRGFERLVLGGTKEATEALAGMLPESLKSKYVGSFRAEQFRTDSEIAEAAAPVAEAAERQEEARLAQEARDRAMKGLPASLGWPETLQCLREGRVYRLVIAEEQVGTPPGDEAFELAWDTDAGIEVVHGEAASILGDNGGVAALLRY